MRPAGSGVDAIAQEFRFAAPPGLKNKLPPSSNPRLQLSPPLANETFSLESKIRGVNQAEHARHASGLNVSQERSPQPPRLGLDQSKKNYRAGKRFDRGLVLMGPH
jgi:hypothetical protein